MVGDGKRERQRHSTARHGQQQGDSDRQRLSQVSVLQVDESSMTGESDHVEVNQTQNPFLVSGTNGYAKIGLAVAFLVLVVLLGCYFTGNTKDENGKIEFNGSKTKAEDVINGVVGIILAAVTIVFVAIPKGLEKLRKKTSPRGGDHQKLGICPHRYCSHPQHKLVRAEKDAILQFCKDCKARIFGLSLCYKCNDCNEYLHEACLNAKPNSTKRYPFSPSFPLKFSTEEMKEKKLYCTACRSYIEGINYTGSHANKEYRLHPQCLELPLNLRRCLEQSPNLGRDSECKGMNLKLELEQFSEMPTNRRCRVCNTEDGKGWCYSIESNGEFKFACHVHCLKEELAKDWLREMISVEVADRKQNFESHLKKFTKKIIGGLAWEVVAVGLDLMISAFVGAPFVHIISAGLGVSVNVFWDMGQSRMKRKHIGS